MNLHIKTASNGSAYKPIANAFDSKDLEGGIFAEIAPQFGDVYVEVAAVEKAVVAPNGIQQFPTVNDTIAVLKQVQKQFAFAVRQFSFFGTAT
jgi:hypothetical protein